MIKRSFHKKWVSIALVASSLFLGNCSDPVSTDDSLPKSDIVSVGGVKQQLIESALYKMNSGSGTQTNGAIEHEVYVDSFYIDQYEVSQKEYQRLMGVNPSSFKTDPNSSLFPVENVTWGDAALYCNERSKEDGLDTVYSYSSITGIYGDNCELENITIHYDVIGYRLPTEAEWELAARGKYYDYSGATEWVNGNYRISEISWNKSNADDKTHEVGTLIPNSEGVYDLMGNVWEWCNDLYSDSYYLTSNYSNPTGPKVADSSSTGSKGHVRRGGSWFDETYELETTWRLGHASTYSNVGFRAVLPISKNYVTNPISAMKLIEDDSISLYVDSTEVSQKRFYSVMNINSSSNVNPNAPVEMISWGDAALYCNQLSRIAGLEEVYSYSSIGGDIGNGCTLQGLSIDHSKKGYRLPTEAEFRYLAGTSTSASIVSIENGTGKPSSVIGTTPNEFGLYNMKGNVWEWIEQEDFVTTSRMGGGYETTIEVINALEVNVKNSIAAKSIGFRVVLVE